MPKQGASVFSDSLPSKFTANMNAATSKYGVLCDIPWTFVGVAIFVVICIGTFVRNPDLPVWTVVTPVCIPLLITLGARLALLNARKTVVDWLNKLPFPVENTNAVLAGSGEHFCVYFDEDAPKREVMMEFLERASEDTFVVERDDETKSVTGQFGINPSKLNPLGEAHRRYRRMREVVELALIPMNETYRIKSVLIV
ncbi:MAG: hypothetical protein FWD57_07740 [Polyangiaceae bacterium]|nr:hypothetical protein [Polyangiaceae bacterium]